MLESVSSVGCCTVTTFGGVDLQHELWENRRKNIALFVKLDVLVAYIDMATAKTA